VADLQNFIDVNSVISVVTDENVILSPAPELHARA
jgi:K+/H+ antiporter YhaU regulatory subunit KhtT